MALNEGYWINRNKDVDKLIGDLRFKEEQDLASIKGNVSRLTLVEGKRDEFGESCRKLSVEIGYTCHEIIADRKGDAWSLGFAFLAHHALSNLALSGYVPDPDLRDAMLFNLRSMASAGVVGLPDRAARFKRWLRTLEKFGEIKEPAFSMEPHPFSEMFSLSIRLVRASGPSLSGFVAFYASNAGTLHRIQPG